MPTTPNMGFVIPTEDSDTGIWDTILNDFFTDQLDGCFGYVDVNVAPSGTVTLTQAQNNWAGLNFYGTLTGNVTVVVLAVPKIWLVKNSTAGAFSVTVKPDGGTGVTVAQDATALLVCNGTVVDDWSPGTVAAGAAASISQTKEAMPLRIETAANGDRTFWQHMPHGGTMNNTFVQSDSGTCTVQMLKNGTLVGNSNAVSTSESNASQSFTWAAGDDLGLRISSNSSCLGLRFMGSYTRTLDG